MSGRATRQHAGDQGLARRVLFGQEQIAEAVARLGRQVSATYDGGELVVLSVLHGALVFTADLIRWIDLPLCVDTISARSYRDGATTPGALELGAGPREPLAGRHVLVVDGIVDTGRTLERVTADLRRADPASLRVAVLLDKPSRRVVPVPVDFVGFTIPDVFVVGYGLDLDGRYRNLPDLRVLDPDGSGEGG